MHCAVTGLHIIFPIHSKAPNRQKVAIGMLAVQTLPKRSSWLLHIPCVSRLKPLSGLLNYAVTWHCTTVLSTCANLIPALDVILPYKVGCSKTMGRSSALSPFIPHTHSISTLEPPCVHSRHVRHLWRRCRCWYVLSYSKGEPTMIQIDLPFGDSDFGNTSEKTSDLYVIQSERHVDVVHDKWKGSNERILLVRVST